MTRRFTLSGVTFVYVPMRAGRFVARRTRVDGRRVVVIETAAGIVGSIGPLLLPSPTGRGDSVALGVVLTTAAGVWSLPIVPGAKGVRVVLDASGQEVARVDRLSRTTSALHLRSGTLTWINSVFRPQYEVEGGFTANRRVVHKLVPGFSGRPFTGEITPLLAERPDGALVVMLAAWCTAERIQMKVVAGSRDANSP